jgi:hypothetical protein
VEVQSNLRRILCGAIRVVATVLFSASAIAAATITGTHYEELKSSNCGSTATACAMSMNAVPSNMNLLVTKVSCQATYHGPGPSFAYFQFGHKTPTAAAAIDQGTGPFTFLAPTLLLSTSAAAGLKVYAVNADTDQMFTSGQIPYFFQSINSGTFALFKCSIFGTLTPSAS